MEAALNELVEVVEAHDHYLSQDLELRLQAIEKVLEDKNPKSPQEPKVLNSLKLGIHNAILAVPEHIVLIAISVYITNRWGQEIVDYLFN